MTDNFRQYEPQKPGSQDGPSNLPLLLIPTGFLCVTIVMVLLQPGLNSAPTRIAATQDDLMNRSGHSDLTYSVAPSRDSDDVVARAQAPFLGAGPVIANLPVSDLIAREMRNPVRQASSSRHIDLPALAGLVVRRFDIKGEAALGVHQGLEENLVQLILQRYPDDVIVAELNAAASNSVFRVPAALLDTSRQLDGAALLAAMLEGASGYRVAPSRPIASSSRHVVREGDSVAGLALQYYGSPFDYPDILKANAWINPSAPVLVSGTELRLPPI